MTTDLRVSVKPIAWLPNGPVNLWSGQLIFGIYYTLYDEQDGWRVFQQHMLSEYRPNEVAFVPTIDAAKAAAQAHYEARILSTLVSPAPAEGEAVPVAWRDETDAEHIARDIKEGRFPARSERQQRPAIDDAWERIRSDGELDAARRKLSMHELRRIIKHAVNAHVELAAAAPVAPTVTEAARQIIHELAADIRDRLSAEEGSATWRDAQRILELTRPAALASVEPSSNG